MQRWLSRSVFELELLDKCSGYVCFRVVGEKALECFKNESGGHRWQRIPPTERRGRIQTSTITVAVLKEASQQDMQIKDSDLEWRFSRGTGPGGQHKNKTDTCVQLTHRSTKITVRCDGRSQHANKISALSILCARLKELAENQIHSAANDSRQQQIGSGMRGDKVRTIRVKDDIVVDHKLNRKTRYSKYIKGDLSDLR